MIAAELERVILQLFLLDDFEHGFADGGGDRVSAKRVEVNVAREDCAIFGVVTTAASG